MAEPRSDGDLAPTATPPADDPLAGSTTEVAPDTPLASNTESAAAGNAAGAVEDAVAVEIGILQDLLEKPPAEVAAWALEQSKALGDKKTEVESLPIFKVAQALKMAQAGEKEALLNSVMQGVGDLPVEQRAEALRLMTQMPAGVTAESLAASSSSSSGQEAASALSTNLARLAQEAAIKDMAPEELQQIAQVVEKNQGQLVQPLLDAVSELTPEERNGMTDALVSKGLVSEQNRSAVEDAIKPGGTADQFASVMKMVTWAYQHTWLVWALPVLEVALALSFLSSGCWVALLPWLAGDAALANGIAFSAYATKHVLKSAYQEFTDNPLNMANRVQAAMAEGTKFTDAVPGANVAMYLIAGMVGLIFTGAVLVLLGLYELNATLWGASCSSAIRLTAIITCFPIMVMRALLPVAAVFYGMQAARKVQELRGQASGAQPLLSEAEPNYGSVEETPPV